MSAAGSSEDGGGRKRLERYYDFHSKIYDRTRWAFLFGRSAAVDSIPGDPPPSDILEVGCGTGKNIVSMAGRFPDAEICGLDLSQAMLGIASRKTASFGGRVRLIARAYDGPFKPSSFDVILFSYALSMFNPGWDAAVDGAHADLRPGGHIAVADFHSSRFAAFRKWMGINHVRMEAHLLPKLRERFEPVVCDVLPAYGGVWEYFVFIGRRRM
jgi:S-adenosylmethionine-diacylgycerolhomoserine-N-methlytransferase